MTRARTTMLGTMTHSVARKQFIKTTVATVAGACPEGTGAPPKETLYECNRQYETNYVFT